MSNNIENRPESIETSDLINNYSEQINAIKESPAIKQIAHLFENVEGNNLVYIQNTLDRAIVINNTSGELDSMRS